MEYRLGMVRDIDAHHVHEGEGPHGESRLLGLGVYLLGAHPFLGGKEGLGDIHEQNPVDEEAGAVLGDDGDLADGLHGVPRT